MKPAVVDEDRPATSRVTRLSERKEQQRSLGEENFIIKNSNLSHLINEFYKSHPKKCSGSFSIIKHNARLISVPLKIKCSKCDYTSQAVKMYDDYSEKLNALTEESGALRKGKQNSGPRHSKLNTQLAIAVTNTPMGPTGVGEFLSQLHIHPGSEDGLSRLIKKVGPINQQVANQSMGSAIKDLKVLKSKGEEIGFAVDAMYNNSRNRRIGVPMEPATQSIQATVGTNTKKSIGLKIANKLCHNCSKLETDIFL